MAQISFVLPVYNEEDTLPALFEQLLGLREKLTDQLEFIFVDDGSTDRSVELIHTLALQHPFVKTIVFSRNFGHQIAITAGLDTAQGDAVIMMDADLQDPPHVALELIDEWRKGYKVVYAKRRSRGAKESRLKKLTAHVYYRVLNMLSDIPIPTDAGDFRLLDKKVVEELKRFREQNRYLRGLTSFVGFPQTAVLYDRHDRFAGRSKYKLLQQSLKLAIDGVTGFSVKPLRLISYLGLLTAAASFIGGIYITGKRIFFPEYTVSGFTIIVILTFFLHGMQMLILGLLSEYLGRIYIETRKRPLYIIKETKNLPDVS